MGEFTQEPIYAQLARIGRVLSSPVRLRLLDLLDQREWTVEELADEAGFGLKNTSAQLQRLRAANLVTSRKDGIRVHYRLAGDGVSAFLDVLQGFAEDRLAELRDAVTGALGDPAELRPVTADELTERAAGGDLVIVDVRPYDDYAAGHLPGALSLPLESLEAEIHRLPRDAEIVAYCQGPYCVSSVESVAVMRRLGRSARPLLGGFLHWRRSGRRVQVPS